MSYKALSKSYMASSYFAEAARSLANPIASPPLALKKFTKTNSFNYPPYLLTVISNKASFAISTFDLVCYPVILAVKAAIVSRAFCFSSGIYNSITNCLSYPTIK